MIRLFAKLISGRPAIGFGFAAAMTLVLGVGLPQLGFDMRPNSTFASDNEASENLRRLHRIFGPDDNDVVILAEGDGLLEPGALAAQRTFRDRIQAIPHVKFVASIFDLNKLQAAMPLIPVYIGNRFDPVELLDDLRRHPIAADQLVSQDGRIVCLLVRIRGESLSVSDVQQVIDPLKRYAQAYEQDTGAKVYLAGHPAIREDVLVTLRRSMLIGCVGAVVMGFIIAMMVFRHLPSVLIAVAAPATGTAWTMGLLAWCDVPVSGLMTALPNLAFIIGLTDAVHLLLEAQRELQRGETQRQSVYDALVRVGPACFLTSLTTCLGFGSLMLSRTDSVREFGFWAAVGTTCAMIAVVTVLPTILLIIPRSWTSNQRTAGNRLGRWIQKLIAPTLVRPGVTTGIAIALCAALIYPAIRQQPDIVWTETMPSRSSSVLAMGRADEEFGGALLAYLMIQWPQDKEFPDRTTIQATADAHQIFDQTDGFSGAYSIRNLLASVPGRTLADRFQTIRKRAMIKSGMLVSINDRTLLVSARLPNDGSAALAERLRALTPKLNELRKKYPDHQFTMTGTTVAAAENMTAIIVDLAKSLALAAALIFVVLSIAFGSLRIGLLTIVPNTLPLLVTAAGLTMVDMPLQITSAMTFSLCLGLAVDDTIHILVRYFLNQEHHQDRREAILETVGHVGPALVITTSILLGGFAAMLTSPMPGLRLFAALSGITLITAIVGDLLFFPAMLLWDWRRRGIGDVTESSPQRP